MGRKAVLTGVLALALVLAFAGAAMAETPISNVLETSVIVQESTPQLELTWGTYDDVDEAPYTDAGIDAQRFVTPTLSNNSYTLTVNKGEEYFLAVKSTNNSGEAIDRVLYRMEIRDSNNNLVTNVVTGLQGYSPNTQGQYTWQNVGVSDSIFFWGPSGGFTFPGNTTWVTPFRFTFTEAGTYTVRIYAVQLSKQQ
ncbi:hypothetical protein V3F56_06785 [Moorellaceae bacterium AZ2]